ncbi:hypothetical protein [Stenotrophomonas sp. MMGLT7]|uniref:hypothetical protein n=1 Tax=Stenotrophomonas sp. MMGLT7 TaxID=2901227 RepID=UPI001E2B51FD|nr:hypothetical protein [Stenotrophomonas sp. MMGLT7]MCD7097258.1 hypothetical protein [Stenotrophomonas sp. MMGLT7]
MRNCRNSSPTSAPCRLEWRPSRWLLAALSAMTLLAPVSLWLSALPRPAACLLAPPALAWGAWLLLRESRRPRCELVIPAGAQPASVAGSGVADLQVRWRGPVAFVGWRRADGRRGRLVFWPDTLPSPARRELRLAVAARRASSRAPAVAP